MFVPVAFETSGVWDSEAKAFIRDLRRRIASRGHNFRSHRTCLKSSLLLFKEVALQPVCSMGTFERGMTSWWIV